MKDSIAKPNAMSETLKPAASSFRRSLVGLMLTLAFSMAVLPLAAQEPRAIINEWSQGDGAQREWVEIVVLQHNLNMENWVLRDDNAPSPFLTFTSAFNNLPRGTVIVVYNIGQKNEDLNSLNFDGSSPTCAYVFLPDHSVQLRSVNWNADNAFGDSNDDDNPRLLDNLRQVVHDWDNNNTPAMRAVRPGQRQSVAFCGDDYRQIHDPSKWVRSTWNQATPARPNCPTNEAWINSQRSQSGQVCLEFEQARLSGAEGASNLRVNLRLAAPLPVGNSIIAKIRVRGATPQVVHGADSDYRINAITSPTPEGGSIDLNITGGELQPPSFGVNLLRDCVEEGDEEVIFEIIPDAAYTILDNQACTLAISDVQTDYQLRAQATPDVFCNAGGAYDLWADFTGETPPGTITYTWQPGGQDGQTVNGLPAPAQTSTYTVTATSAREGCTFTAAVTVTVDEANIQLSPTAATVCPGQAVQLTATGGDAGSYVWQPLTGLTANDASATFQSDIEGDYTINLTGQFGDCTGTAQATITVRNDVKPITIDADPAGSCPNQPVQLSASGADNYNWTTDGGSLTPGGGDDTRATFISAAGGSFTIVVTGKRLGCDARGERTIEIQDLPQPAASISPIGTVCPGQSLTLECQVLQNPAGLVYEWVTDNLTLTAEQASARTFTLTAPDEAGTYSLRARIRVGDCVSPFTEDVTFTVASVREMILSGPAVYCQGQEFVLRAPDQDLDPASVSFSPDAADVPDLLNPRVAIVGNEVVFRATPTSAEFDYAIRVSGRTRNGDCLVQSNEVRVRSLPAMVFDPSAPGMSCAGDAVSLPLLNVPDGVTPTITSNPASGIDLVWNDGVLTATGNVPGSYEITAFAVSNGCNLTATHALLVHPRPVVSVESDGGVTQICAGQTLQLDASGADGYEWTPPHRDGNTGATGFVTPTETTTYTVSGSLGLCSGSAEIEITVLPAPDFTSLVRAVSACVGSSKTLGEGLQAQTGVTYQWAPAEGLNDASAMQPEFTPTEEGTTTFTLTGAAGACTAEAEVVVTARPKPTVSITPATPDEILVGTPLTLTAAGADSYVWEPVADITGEANVASVTVVHEEDGDFTYTVTGTEATYGCTNTAQVTVKVVPARTMNVITPNGDGVNDVFFMDVDPLVYKSIETLVFDRFGNRLFSSNAFGEQNGWRGVDRNGGEVPAGSYSFVVKLERRDGRSIQRAGTLTLLR